jgi:hypothetical protein
VAVEPCSPTVITFIHSYHSNPSFSTCFSGDEEMRSERVKRVYKRVLERDFWTGPTSDRRPNLKKPLCA